VAFAYLGLQALQNWSRFGLVAGAIVAWNFAEWARELTVSWQPGLPGRIGSWCLRGGLAGVMAVWIGALLMDRYYIHTGEARHFAFREQPLEFAHEAAVFAGQPGLPERALIYDLGQTGVYVFHNAPRYKPFLDGRLEMPDKQTFLTYVTLESWLAENDPRWEKALADLGNPLVLLEHRNHFRAEAALLIHPNWRCIYYDALASIFVHLSPAQSAMPPAMDFARRHFLELGGDAVPAAAGAAALELKGLFKLSVPLPRSPEATWRWRIPILWVALDRARMAIGEEPEWPELWTLLGNCYWNLNPDLTSQPPGPAEAWSPQPGIYWAQATYCLRRAVEMDPEHAPAWRSLCQCYRARGMADAELSAGRNWLRTDPRITKDQQERIRALERAVGQKQLLFPTGDLLLNTTSLLQAGRPEAAAQLIDHAPNCLGWKLAEQAAALYLHLGRPAAARSIWDQARDCPSAALRHCRLATTFWVERDFEAAVHQFQEAQQADPQLAEASWGLAMLQAQVGKAAPAVEACKKGLQLTLDPRQRGDLEALQARLATVW
jgi:tetratricopeptide (TPR) repeat protein